MALTGDAARVAKLAQSLGASKSKAEGAVSSVLAKSGGSNSKPGAGVPANTASDVQWLANQGFLTDNSAAGVQKAISVANLAQQAPTPIAIPQPLVTPIAPMVPIATNPAVNPMVDNTQNDATKAFQSYLNETANVMNEVPSAEETYSKLEKDLQIKQKEKAVNDLTTTQNTILAQGNADIMAIRNQSSQEGGTVGILSAREDAINRSVAIKVLPIQAQLAAAQGNLTLAQNRLDTLLSLRMKDAETKYTNKLKLLDATYNFMTEQQKIQADAIAEQTAMNWEREKLDIQNQHDINMKSIGLDSGISSENAPLYSGLNSATATAVRGQVGAFKSEPTIQNFAVIQEGRNFANAIPNNTKNPADDQGLIYALAKALDPGSVVREGEYATAQKYSQSWINAYGKSISQAIAGTGFLSEEARKNIKATIETKYNSSRMSYDNLYSQYEKGINNLTGRTDGKDFLRDYLIPEVTKEPETKEEATFLDTINNTGGYWSNLWKSIIGK
jgi:hypothetical protein